MTVFLVGSDVESERSVVICRRSNPAWVRGSCGTGRDGTGRDCATIMALPQHPPRMLLAAAVLLLLALGRRVAARSSPISDLKSKISGVEELLEEFRHQLQQEQSSKVGSGTESCVGDFGSLGDSIIQTKPSIEQGATFLLVPDRVFTWKDCLHACCSQPHCTVAVVREDRRQPGKSLKCYLFNCTYRNKHVCSFSPHPGFSAYSRDANSSQGHLPGPAGGSATVTGAGQPGEGDPPGGTDMGGVHRDTGSGMMVKVKRSGFILWR